MQLFSNDSKFRRWSHFSRREIRDIIFRMLIDYKYGLTIIDISKILKLSRKVAGEEIHNLANTNKIRLRRVGNSILCYRKSYYKESKNHKPTKR